MSVDGNLERQGIAPQMIDVAKDQSQLVYEVDFKEASRHLISISLWIRNVACGNDATQETVKIIFPVWTPGSYMVREYTRNIESLVVTAHAVCGSESTRNVPVTRESKNVWQVEFEESDWIQVRYQLYCREMSVRTNWVESDFGFLTGAAAFPYMDGLQSEPIEIRLTGMPQWDSLATSLKQVERTEQAITLRAANYDDLVDSPIAMGRFPVKRFDVGEHAHYLANVGNDDLWDVDKAVADVSRIVAEEQRFWGEVPYEEYWFINLLTETGGGLEHDNSTVLMTSRWAMRKRESYLNWLALVSHEFFHTWNVRRLRPKALMSYDYQQEQYLRELWIAEGITSYFDDLFLVWTGLCTRDEYLCRLSKNIQTVQSAPGRLVQGLADASWDAWIKHYRPDENTQNARISYYLKGAVLAWMLDAQLRDRSGGANDLAKLMKQLWQEFRYTGYTICDFERLVELHAGTELRSWLEQQVREPIELDLEPALRYFGLRFKTTTGKKDNACDKPSSDVWIGSDSTFTDGRLLVRRVYRGSPSDLAGLNVDDELIALDGYRLTTDAWPDRLAMYQPGETLDLLVSRRGRLKQMQICLGKKPAHNWQLELDPAATLDSKSHLSNWLEPNADAKAPSSTTAKLASAASRSKAKPAQA